jgi:hypothetical protein
MVERHFLMKSEWIKPDFQEIAVNGECTSYAGSS